MSGIRMRNIGKGRWRHTKTQEVVLPNGIFYATEAMVERMRARGQLGVRFEIMPEQEAPQAIVEPAPTNEEGGEEEGGEEEGGEEEGEGLYSPTMDDWTLKMAPGTYLSLHPEGPHAELARQLVKPE